MRLRGFACVLSVCASLPLAACSGGAFEVPSPEDDAALDAAADAGDVGGGDVVRPDVAPDAAADASDTGVDSTVLDAADATSDAGDASSDAADAADALLDASDAGDALSDAGDAGCTTGATRSCYSGTDASRVGHGICHAGTSTCMSGVWGNCVNDQTPQTETCNGLDDDCNDTVDDAPGAGTDCSGTLGAGSGCAARTMCVKSGSAWVATPQCVGTFVSPSGSATNGGSPTQPLNSISAAITHAQALGVGTDVCVCASGSTTALFTEKVRMVEGTSVIGSYDCSTWVRPSALPATPLTTIQDVDAEGVLVPAGVTSVTAIDGMSVRGFATSAAAGVSNAISVIDAGPTLASLNVGGGSAATSVGLGVSSSMAGKSTPTISGGTYAAQATMGGSQAAIVLQGAAARLAGVTAQNAFLSVGTAANSIALRCIGCAGTTIARSTFSPGTATSLTKGLWASGDLTGFAVDAGATSTLTTFNGGTVSGPAVTGGAPPYAASVQLESCTGNPRFDWARLSGGGTTLAVAQTARLYGLDASGASCSATFTGGLIRGCEAGGNCFGAWVDGAPVTFANLTNANFAGILGTQSTATYQTIGLRCVNGGCRSVTGSAIAAGGVGVGLAGGFSAGLSVLHASPIFDANVVTAPSCGNAGNPTGSLYGAHLAGSTTASFTNSVFRDAPCSAQVEVVYVSKVSTAAATFSATLVNDTIEYGNCGALGCGTRMGLSFDETGPSIGGGSYGHFDDNIIRNVVTSSSGSPYKSYAVYQFGPNGDWETFSANDLYDLNAWNGGNPVLFNWHNLSLLSTAGAVNSTLGSTAVPKANLSVDPLLDATWHLLPGSLCIDAADPASATKTDRDGQARPSGAGYDIGADEK